jgi:hypothetical protein
MWHAIVFYYECIKEAARGSLALANSWAWLVGAVVVGGAAGIPGFN